MPALPGSNSMPLNALNQPATCLQRVRPLYHGQPGQSVNPCNCQCHALHEPRLNRLKRWSEAAVGPESSHTSSDWPRTTMCMPIRVRLRTGRQCRSERRLVVVPAVTVSGLSDQQLPIPILLSASSYPPRPASHRTAHLHATPAASTTRLSASASFRPPTAPLAPSSPPYLVSNGVQHHLKQRCTRVVRQSVQPHARCIHLQQCALLS
jgi:hypothetical protein